MSRSGIVKSYNVVKGFGFIVPETGEEDIFVLRTDVTGDTLVTGDNVRYDDGMNERTGKKKAVNVTGGTGGPDMGPPKGGGKGGKGKGGGMMDFGGRGMMPGCGKGGSGGPFMGGAPAPGGFNPCGGGGFMPGGGGAIGVVKFFNDEKGFGFINPGDGSGDVFVHRNDIVGGSLNEGDQVQYDAIMNDRTGKPKATNVRGGTGGEMGGGGGMKGGGKGGFKGGGPKGGGGKGGGGMPMGGPQGMPGGFDRSPAPGGFLTDQRMPPQPGSGLGGAPQMFGGYGMPPGPGGGFQGGPLGTAPGGGAFLGGLPMGAFGGSGGPPSGPGDFGAPPQPFQGQLGQQGFPMQY